jgi:hypothetical protein
MEMTGRLTEEQVTAVMTRHWRVGRKLRRTLYACVDPDGVPSAEDIWFGSADDAAIAEHICELHNDYLWRARQGATTAATPDERARRAWRGLRLGPAT